jgi:hypothetical protein
MGIDLFDVTVRIEKSFQIELSETLRFADVDLDVLISLATAWAQFEPVADFANQLFSPLLASRGSHFNDADFRSFMPQRPLPVRFAYNPG